MVAGPLPPPPAPHFRPRGAARQSIGLGTPVWPRAALSCRQIGPNCPQLGVPENRSPIIWGGRGRLAGGRGRGSCLQEVQVASDSAGGRRFAGQCGGGTKAEWTGCAEALPGWRESRGGAWRRRRVGLIEWGGACSWAADCVRADSVRRACRAVRVRRASFHTGACLWGWWALSVRVARSLWIARSWPILASESMQNGAQNEARDQIGRNLRVGQTGPTEISI